MSTVNYPLSPSTAKPELLGQTVVVIGGALASDSKRHVGVGKPSARRPGRAGSPFLS